MNRLIMTKQNALRRKNRVRANVFGTKQQPRLTVRISNRHITAQVIDDTNGKTLAFVSTAGNKQAKGTMTEKARWVGDELARKAKTAKIKHVVFDRGSKLYHGRAAALAEAARNGGLEF